MAVVGRPRKEYNFDGKIWLQRVSEEVTLQRRTTNQNFTDNVSINTYLKQGGWHLLYPEGDNITCDEMIGIIASQYGLEVAVADCLVFTYKICIGDQDNTKIVILKYNNLFLDSNI